MKLRESVQSKFIWPGLNMVQVVTLRSAELVISNFKTLIIGQFLASENCGPMKRSTIVVHAEWSATL